MEQDTPPFIRNFADRHYRHFNAAVIGDAARAYEACMHRGARMMITLAGAMSTAELGRSLAEMIRRDKVHIISCTGANLEEDVMNLVAHDHYERVPHYRDLSPDEEQTLLDRGLNRVTDTCIPEDEAFRKLEGVMVELWKEAELAGKRKFPHEFFYDALLSGQLDDAFQIDPADSWMHAAAEKGLPIVCPGWEDSTLGNIFAAHCIEGDVRPSTVKGGIEYMMYLAQWYTQTTEETGEGVGFFQIGGGIAGISPSAWCPCCTRTSARRAFPSGLTSARFQTARPAMAAIPALCPTRRLPGASSVWIRRGSSSNPMRPSWRPSFSAGFWTGNLH